MVKLPQFPEEKYLAEKLKTPQSLAAYEKLRIGLEIKSTRQNKHMTQKELAYKFGTSQSVIARIETGKQNLTLETLIKISFILGIKLQIQM